MEMNEYCSEVKKINLLGWEKYDTVSSIVELTPYTNN